MGEHRLRLLIDTDTASDDAVALAMALRHPTRPTIEAITVVAGNVPLAQAVQNALYTVERCSPADRPAPPVYAGCSQPLLRDLRSAEAVHGHDGMGDIGLDLDHRTPTAGHAVDVIIDAVRQAPHQLTLVTLGPLTNVATVLLRSPDIAALIPRCVVMGGQGAGPGNTSAVAEFNMWVDPEAARVVMRSGIPLQFVGWDVCRTGGLVTGTDQQRLRQLSPVGAFAMDINGTLDAWARANSGIDGIDLADPVAMAVALDPSLATFERHSVDVVWGHHPCEGQLIIDWLDSAIAADGSSAELCTAVDHQRFLAMLADCLAG